MTGLAMLAVVLAQAPAPAPLQDSGAQAMVERARVVRDRELDGIRSYEGLLRERIYAGLEVRAFGRERALYDAERVARVRWERDAGRTIQWLAAREDAPVLGARGRVSWSRDDGDGEGGQIGLGVTSADAPSSDADTEDGILRRLNPLVFDYRPGDDRLVFGNRFALHPLADSAPRHYTYRSGDTLTLQLPTGNRTISLVEIVVEPTRADFALIAGSLWFDLETAALVQAHYRPSRPFDLELDEGENVPGILSPFRVRVDYLTIEYSLHEGEWWLPRRFALGGEVSAGGSFKIPAAVDWRVSNYRLNTRDSDIPAEPPPGWVSHTDSVESRRGQAEGLRILAPPIDSLRSSPLLTGESFRASEGTFADGELDQIREALDALAPAADGRGTGVRYGWADGNLRYNRVEGLGVGLSLEHAVGRRSTVEPRLRFGLADRQLRGSLSLTRQGSIGREVGISAFRRLAHTDDFGDPHGFGASLTNFVFQNGHAQFYDAVGVEAHAAREGRRTQLRVRAFWEDHSSVGRTTNFYAWHPFTGDSVPSVIDADEGRVGGLAGEFGWQAGADPTSWIASGRVGAEVAEGDFAYRRVLATLSLSRPLALGASGGLELGGGYTWGDLPAQKNFFIGGDRTLRGYPGSHRGGEAFWMMRGEVGTASPVARFSVFSDLGWAGPRSEFRTSRALWSWGAGLSFLDGLLRLDAAWPIRGGDGGRLYLYLDGIL